jgi:hypothetical protein
LIPQSSFEFKIEEIGEGTDTAIAVSLAHDLSPAVRAFVQGLPTMGRILHARLPTSRRSVQSGSEGSLKRMEMTPLRSDGKSFSSTLLTKKHRLRPMADMKSPASNTQLSRARWYPKSGRRLWQEQ